MFHILAMATLYVYIVFFTMTGYGLWRGLIRSQLIDWDDRDGAPKTQLIHSYFAAGLIILIFLTFLFAPTQKFIWLVMLAIFATSHLKPRIRIDIKMPWLRIIKWAGVIAELAYMVFLAYGVR